MTVDPGRLEALLPRLRPGHYEITSPAEDGYNCLAWAHGDSTREWWPGDVPGYYWPVDVDPGFDESVGAFVTELEKIGWTPCPDSGVEPGQIKMVLYARADGFVQHAARQVENGWASKIGTLEDIVHATARDAGGGTYGEPVAYLRRGTPPVIPWPPVLPTGGAPGGPRGR